MSFLGASTISLLMGVANLSYFAGADQSHVAIGLLM
jgi:hypothetical protein